MSSTLRLPAGMRDFAPGAAAARRRIAETLVGVFERWGYARVITPAFEYEDVLALGLGGSGRAAAVRFVEPSSGQVVALRPDITPQIARLIATRYREERGPIRLCYEGTVVRFDPRARTQREIIQAGCELAGLEGPGGDAEAITLTAAALAAVGLEQPTIDLAHLGLAREVLGALGLPEEVEPVARERIARRDRAGLAEVLRDARGPRAVVEFAHVLPELSGPPEILAQAQKRAPTPGIRFALEALSDVVAELRREEIAARLHVDLGEIRGFDYYTGVRFQAFVQGAPTAVVQGGRYDALIGRYGRPRPAVGFAVDVEAAAVALEQRDGLAGASGGLAPSGVLVVGSQTAGARKAADLRASGQRVALVPRSLPRTEIEAYARRWGFAEVVDAGEGEVRSKGGVGVGKKRSARAPSTRVKG